MISSRSSPGKLACIGLISTLLVLALSSPEVQGSTQPRIFVNATEKFRPDLVIEMTNKFATDMSSGDLNDQRKQKLEQDFLSQLRIILQQEVTGFEDVRVTAITVQDKFVRISWYMKVDRDDAAFDQKDKTEISNILEQDFENVKKRFGNITLDTKPGIGDFAFQSAEEDSDNDEWILPVAISLGVIGLIGVLVLIGLMVLILHRMRQRSGAGPRRLSNVGSSSADSQASTQGEHNYTYVVDLAGEKSQPAYNIPQSLTSSVSSTPNYTNVLKPHL